MIERKPIEDVMLEAREAYSADDILNPVQPSAPVPTQTPLVGAPRGESQDIANAMNDRLKMTVYTGSRESPDEAGRKRRELQELGLPSFPEVPLDANMVRQRKAVQDATALDLPNNNPRLAQALLEYPELAAVSSDSLAELNRFTYDLAHSRFAASSPLPDFIDRAYLDFELAFQSSFARSKAHIEAAEQNIAGEAYGRRLLFRGADGSMELEGGDQKRLTREGIEQYQRSQLMNPAGDPDNWFMGMIRYTASELGRNWAKAELYTAIPVAAGVGFLAGGPAGAMAAGVGAWRGVAFASGFIDEAGAMYLELRSQGVSHERARQVAVVHGMAAGAFEFWAVGVSSKPVKKAAETLFRSNARKAVARTTRWSVAREFGTDLLKVNAAEAFTEGLQAASFQAFGKLARMSEDPEWRDRLAESGQRGDILGAFMEDFWYTFKYGWLMAGAGPTINAIAQLNRYERDRNNFEKFGNLIEQASSLKPITRNAVAAREALRVITNGTNAENVFTDADGVDAMLRQTGLTIQQLDQVLPGIADKYAKSRAENNAPIRIATADYLTQTVGTKYEPQIRSQLRMSEQGRSLAEVVALAPETARMAQEMETLIARAEAIDKDQARQLDAVEDKAFRAISATSTRMSEPHQRAMAKFLRDRIMSLAVRMNMTVEQAERAFPLDIEGRVRHEDSKIAEMAKRRAQQANPLGDLKRAEELNAAAKEGADSIQFGQLDARTKKRLSESVQHISQALKLKDLVELAVQAWRLKSRIDSGATTPQMEALLSKIMSVLKDAGIAFDDPIGQPWEPGWVAVNVTTESEAIPGKPPTVTKTLVPIVTQNGMIVRRADVIVSKPSPEALAAREAKIAAARDRLEARLAAEAEAEGQPEAAPPPEPSVTPLPPSDRELKQEALKKTPLWFEWWKKSKAVDTDGQPLFLYRGAQPNGEYGDQSRVPTAGLSGGIFLSVNPAYAATYGSQVIEVVASIQNPLDLSKAPNTTLDGWIGVLKAAGLETAGIRFDSSLTRDPLIGEVLPDGRRVYSFYELISKVSDYYADDGNLISEIRRQGFDGVMSQPEVHLEDATEVSAPVWVVFDSTQLKSTSNVAPTESPDIFEQAQTLDDQFFALAKTNDQQGVVDLMRNVAVSRGFAGITIDMSVSVTTPEGKVEIPAPVNIMDFHFVDLMSAEPMPPSAGMPINVVSGVQMLQDTMRHVSDVDFAIQEVRAKRETVEIPPMRREARSQSVYVRVINPMEFISGKMDSVAFAGLQTYYDMATKEELDAVIDPTLRGSYPLSGQTVREVVEYWLEDPNRVREAYFAIATNPAPQLQPLRDFVSSTFDAIVFGYDYTSPPELNAYVFNRNQIKSANPWVRDYNRIYPTSTPENDFLVPPSVRYNIGSDLFFEQPETLDDRYYRLFSNQYAPGNTEKARGMVESSAEQTNYGWPFATDPSAEMLGLPRRTVSWYWFGFARDWTDQLPDDVPIALRASREDAEREAGELRGWQYEQAKKARELADMEQQLSREVGDGFRRAAPEPQEMRVNQMFVRADRAMDARQNDIALRQLIGDWLTTNPDNLSPQDESVRLWTGAMTGQRSLAQAFRQAFEGVRYAREIGESDSNTHASFIKYMKARFDAIAIGSTYGVTQSDAERKGGPYAPSTVYVFNKVNVKDAETFVMTYSPQTMDTRQQYGALVPLSRRFNPRSPFVFEQAALSTRVPTGKKAVEDAFDEILLADFDSFMRDPEFLKKNLAVFRKLAAPVRTSAKATPQQQAQDIMDHVVDNLIWLHDLLDPAIRTRAAEWYKGANRIAQWLADRHGMSLMQAAAVYAVLSPQKDWYENVSLGNRIADIAMTQRDAVMSPAMEKAYIDSLEEGLALAKKRLAAHKRKSKMPTGADPDVMNEWKAERAALKNKVSTATEAIAKAKSNLARIGKRTLGEMLAAREFDIAAVLVRWWDETNNDKAYSIITPEGGMGSARMTSQGSPSILRYGGYGSVAKALSVIIDGSAENVHNQIGDEHKVRNFYNNILNPGDPRYITIDTHAIAAGLLMALAGTDPLVMHGLGGRVSNTNIGLGGAYAMYFDAYRRAAAARGLIGREMQSITWEAIRGLFEASNKRSLKAPIAKVWAKYKRGKMTMAQARAEVLRLSGGITTPSWVSLPTNIPPSAGYTGPSQKAADVQSGTRTFSQLYADIAFEVAPDPRNKTLLNDWNNLSASDRTAVSLKIAKDIVAKVLDEYGVTGQLLVQVGGWHDSNTTSQPKWTRTTNTSFALRLDNADRAVAVARAIGIALAQEGMFVTADQQFEGAGLSNAITVELQPGTTVSEITNLYENVFAGVLDKHQILGHSTVNDVMVLILPDGVDSATVETGLSNAAASANSTSIIDIDTTKVWSRYEDTGKLHSEADARRKQGAAGPLFPWRRARELRADAAKQLRAAIDNVNAGRLPQAAVRPEFYSALERAVGSVPSAALSPQDWKNAITGMVNKGIVKQDERDWSHIDQYLDMQDGKKVARSDVLDFLRNKGIRVKTNVQRELSDFDAEIRQMAVDDIEANLGETMTDAEAKPIMDLAKKYIAALNTPEADLNALAKMRTALDGRLQAALDYYDYQHFYDTARERFAEQYPERIADYSSYAIPGGTNYRVRTITIPGLTEVQHYVLQFASKANAAEIKKMLKDANYPQLKTFKLVNDYNLTYEVDGPLTPEVLAALEKDGVHVRPYYDPSTNYYSDHFEHFKNVVVHIREQEFIDDDGKRVRLIVEIQSDWGQNLRSLMDLAVEDVVYDAQANMWIAIDTRGREVSQARTEATARKLGEEWVAKKAKTVPQGPFVNRTNAWVTLAWKQILLDAVADGIDKVALIDGDLAANWFSQQHRVNELMYSRRKNGNYDILARFREPNVRVAKSEFHSLNDGEFENVPPSRLKVILGDELGQMILDGAGLEATKEDLAKRKLSVRREMERPQRISTTPVRILKVKATIGGMGNKLFYGGIALTNMGDVVRKYGGPQITDVKFGVKGNKTFDWKAIATDAYEVVRGEMAADEFIVYNGLESLTNVTEVDDALGGFRSDPGRRSEMKGVAKDFAQALKAKAALMKRYSFKGFEVTPQLAERVRPGLPLFQASRGPARGYYDLLLRTIKLTESSDFTTVWHEMLHAHLEDLTSIANSGNATDDVKNDMDIILRWFGIAGATPEARLAAWTRMTLDERRPHHEAFAYNGEIYLWEGKAPSIELEGVFQRMKVWIRRIYKSILTELNQMYREQFGRDLPMLTDEVRGVFGRMLATPDQIARAEAARSMTPLFVVRHEGMTDQDWQQYQELANRATMESISDLERQSLKVMQWASGATSRILRRMQREHRELREEVREEVEQQIAMDPLYRAMRYIRTGSSTNPDGSQIKALNAHRLDMDALEEMYPVSMTNRPDLSRLGTGGAGMMGRDGVHPDIIAEQFGYYSGDQLVRALVEALPEQEEIKARTDRIMTERYGEMNTPEAQREAVEKALHNEVRTRMIAVEHRMLSGATTPERAMIDAAKMAARSTVSGQRIRDIRPSSYVAGETRAAKDAENAYARRMSPQEIGRLAYERSMTEQDSAIAAGMSRDEAMKVAERERDKAVARAEARVEEYKSRYGNAKPAEIAVRAKRNQLFQNQLARAAFDAVEEVRKKIRYLRRVLTDENRKRMGADYADQIEKILERYELRALTLREIDKRKSLAQFLKEQEALGLTPDIALHLQAEATRMSYRDMTLADFRELVDAVKQLEFMGRQETDAARSAKTAQFEADRNKIVENIRKNAAERGRVTDPLTAPSGTFRSTMQNAGKFFGSHLKAATIAQILDGTIDGGPLWEVMIRTANAAGERETQMNAEATEALTEIMAPLFKGQRMIGKGQRFESIGMNLNMEGRVTIALNWGNESNRQRVTGGFGWTREEVRPVLESLTAEQWNIVQAIWDYFESYKEQIADKQRRVYGKEPDWIEAAPFEVQTADGQTIQLRGGYYPVVYDPRASARGSSLPELEQAKAMMEGGHISATTRRSYTMTRVEEVYDMPLLLRLDGIYRGVNQVIHDLTHHEWLIDVNRLMRDKEFQNAVITTLGPEAYAQLRDWIKDVAQGSNPVQTALDGAANILRQNVSVAGLGVNLMTVMSQIVGLNQSIVRVGYKWIGLGFAQLMTDPVGSYRRARENSLLMADRGRTQFRELNELKNRVSGENPIVRRYRMSMYLPIVRMQSVVDVITWNGAYERARSLGADHETSVARSNQAVVDTQGSGMIKDLSKIERGGALLKLFTVFYNYMNTPYNMTALMAMTNKSKGKTIHDVLMILLVPVVLMRAIKSGLRPDEQDEEFDLEKLAKSLAAEQLEYLMGMMVIVREFAYAGKNLIGAEGAGRGYGGPAGLRAIQDVGVLATQIQQGEADTAFRKAAINLLGDTMGLPSAQINRTIDGVEATMEGKIDNPVDAARAILFGIEK